MRDKIVVVHTRVKNAATYASYIEKEVNILGVECKREVHVEFDRWFESLGWLPEKTLLHLRSAGSMVNQMGKQWQKQGFEVVNPPQVMNRTSDKYLTYEWAVGHGLSLPKTEKARKGEVVKALDDFEGRQVVVKPVNSKSQGAFCFKTSVNDSDLEAKVAQVPTDEVIVQDLIAYKRIYRVIVIGDKALREAVFMDEPREDDWKVSVCLNPQAVHVPNPPDGLLDYGLKVAKTFGLEIGFIDVYETEAEFILSEINTACVLMQHERKSRYNISGDIAKYLVERLRR